jgi:hypothetical protein
MQGISSYQNYSTLVSNDACTIQGMRALYCNGTSSMYVCMYKGGP